METVCREILAEARRVCGFTVQSDRANEIDAAFLRFLGEWTATAVAGAVADAVLGAEAAGVSAVLDAVAALAPMSGPLCDAKPPQFVPAVLQRRTLDAGAAGVASQRGAPLRAAARGAMGAGKSTMVARLIATRGGTEVSFAAPLYHILHWAQWRIGVPMQKDRVFLQYCGTEWGRAHDDGVWIRLALERIEEHAAENVFVSDARFPNEVQTLRAHGFVVAEVVAPASEATARAVIGNGSLAHASERALDGMQSHIRIYNSHSSLEHFYALVDEFADDIASAAWTNAPRFYGVRDSERNRALDECEALSNVYAI